MIICDDFVFLHLPKTGGTFVTHVLCRVLDRLGKPYRDVQKHDPYGSIPVVDRGKPVFACVRRPHDLKVSIYRFGWWRKHTLPEYAALARRTWPAFPDLSFAEFVNWWDSSTPIAIRARELNPFCAELGRESLMFIAFFTRHPTDVFARLNEAFVTDGSVRQHLAPVHFLKTGSLNRDLHAFLAGLGYPEDTIAFIRDEGRILPPEGGRNENDHWQSMYGPDLMELVTRRERLLFSLFPEFEPPGRDSEP